MFCPTSSDEMMGAPAICSKTPGNEWFSAQRSWFHLLSHTRLSKSAKSRPLMVFSMCFQCVFCHIQLNVRLCPLFCHFFVDLLRLHCGVALLSRHLRQTWEDPTDPTVSQWHQWYSNAITNWNNGITMEINEINLMVMMVFQWYHYLVMAKSDLSNLCLRCSYWNLRHYWNHGHDKVSSFSHRFPPVPRFLAKPQPQRLKLSAAAWCDIHVLPIKRSKWNITCTCTFEIS